MNSYFSGRYRLLSYLLILLLQLMGSIGVTAQQFYPVQVRSYVQSPSVFIEDYKDPNNFRVQVTLTDLTVPSLDIILKVSFKGPSGTFESTTGIPLSLVGGVSYTLDRNDLEDLLSPVNLPGAPTTIPEGTYVISFKSVERNSNTPVSNALTDFTSVVVMLNDPPLLTSPGKGELLDLVASGQNFMFSWTPRSFSLNPQQQIKYRLTMALIPPDRNPYDAFLTNAFNINQTFEDIQYNSFFYDQSMLALTPGATYAWQVQAYEGKLVNGEPLTQRFRNEGKSDVFVFKVKEFCPPLFLKNPELKPNPETNKQEILLAWNKDPGHQLYEVKYKIQGSVLPWTIVQLPQEAESLTLGEQQLQKGQTYEYYVSCRCTGWQEAIYGGTFILPASECEAPFPILVNSNDEKGIALSWTKVASANAYNVYYTDNNTKITSVKENITDGSVLLPAITRGSYTIHIDAVCGTSTAVGENLELKFDEKDFPGGCPVPSPFTFLAKRPGVGTDPLSAQLTWPKLDLHESFKLTYWHKDAPTDKHTQTLLTPEAIANGIKNNEFYHYTIEFICKGGKTVTTPQGGFRLEGGELDTPLDPPTADCFPPAVHSAEPKNETTARIDWKGISGAEEYVVVYKPKDGSGQEKIFTTTAANAKLTGLTPGTIYQYKIRCKCGGKFSIDSEPGEFDLSKSEKGNKDCDSISNLKIKQITETEIQLSWPYPQPVKPGNKTQTSYTIRYKENGQVWGENYPISLVLTSELQDDYGTQGEVKKTINMLSSGVRYDIEVKAYCGTEDAIANEPLSGTTKEVKEADCSQGGSCDRTSKRPLEGLKIGDTIGVSDYKMKIITLSPDTRGANLWKGTGVAATPLIGKTDNVRFNIDFDSLYVNDKVCVTAGNLKAGLGGQLFDDKTTATIKGLVDDFGTALNDAQKASKDAAKIIDDAQKAGEDALDYFQGGDDVGFVKTGGLGGISTEASNFNDLEVEGNSIKVGGKSYPVDRFPTLVKDKNGNVVSVSSNGTKTEVGHYDESLNGLQNAPTSSSAKVTFRANSNAIYSFDAWQDGYGKSVAMAPHYLNIDGKYYSAKAITPGAIDKVDFDFSGGDKSKLVFVNREGFVFKTLSGSTLQLAGGPAKDGQEILAIYDTGSKKEIAGALLLASYPIVEKKVKLVTLAMGNNFNKDINAIQAQLNKAYNPIGINYTVEVDNSFDSNRDWCDKGNCDFNTGGSGLLNNDYTGVEARVIDAYINFKGEENLEATTAYMFLIGVTKKEQGDEALQGKMNFSKQFGFLYSAASQNPQTLGRTLAHELGHGNYKLYHIFDPMYLGDAARNSDNLMSYNTNVNALALNKLQWDVAHDPGVTWGVFKRDGDQEAIALGDVVEFLKILRKQRLSGQNINLKTSINKKRVWSRESFTVDNFSFDEIEIEFEELSSEITVNPAVYSDYYYDEIFPFSDKFGVSFKDLKNNFAFKIISENKTDIDNLKKYLFGECDVRELLDAIHNASVQKNQVNLSFLNNCQFFQKKDKETIDGIEYTDLSGKFVNVTKGSSIQVNPKDYVETPYGFQIKNKEGNVVFEIVAIGMDASKKDHLKVWLFGDVMTLAKLQSAVTLTATEIKSYRDHIKTLPQSEREIWYLELQEKVEYKNQRDNYGPSKVNNTWATSNIADKMCNLTSLAMAFEYLGISREDVLAKITELNLTLPASLANLQTEDLFEFIRVEKGYSERTSASSWKSIADLFDLNTEEETINSSKSLNQKISTIKDHLKGGKGIVGSIYLYKGHIVRVQDIDETGLLIDDPYGTISSMAKREFKGVVTTNNYNTNSADLAPTGKRGVDNKLLWTEFDVSNNDSGRGGEVEIKSTTIVDTDNNQTFIAWFNAQGLSMPSASDYPVEQRTEIVPKSNPPTTTVNTYYKSYGTIVKYYRIYSRKN